MRGMLAIAFIGAVVSAAAIVAPAESVQAWGPFAVLSTGVGLLAAWLVSADDTPVRANTATHKRAA